VAYTNPIFGQAASDLRKETIMRKIIILLTMWVVIFAGCFHVEEIPTNIAPAVKVTKKYPAKMAVHFSPPLGQFVKVTRPETMYGSRHIYNYNMGPALQAALLKCVESAYSNVSVVNILPRLGEFERVISFDLQSSKIIVEFVPGYLNQEAKSTAELYITMDIIDGSSLKTFQRLTIHGTGFSTEDASGFKAYDPKHFSLAMEDAIQQLAEITTNLLFSGVAELRWGTKGLPRQE
jgi:hypothetical protein